jgi:glycosyltransferase involved in cell wall biosynthesis
MKPESTIAPADVKPVVLWWGRFDPDYSRNRVMRKLLADLGLQVRDFHPKFSDLGDWEARLRGIPRADLVWVPCFRQRDIDAASRWAGKHGVPLLIDPLISAYDKQVDERRKLDPDSRKAKRLLAWERSRFARADRVLADTPAHADYFRQILGVAPNKLAVVYVGSEAALFKPAPRPPRPAGDSLEVLFYGSFIPLQGPQVVIDAARLYKGPPVRWTLLGDGPLRAPCEKQADGLTQVAFEAWLPYEALPDRIRQADILLGIFGATPKAGRVIPNKVYQSLACGRVVVTRHSGAYPEQLAEAENSGIVWTEAGDAQSLADRIAVLAAAPDNLRRLGEAAAQTSRQFFSGAVLRQQLQQALKGLVACDESVFVP